MRKRLIIAGVAAVAAALIVMVLPTSLLEAFIARVQLTTLLPQAAPPLGATARALLAALAFALSLGIGLLVIRLVGDGASSYLGAHAASPALPEVNPPMPHLELGPAMMPIPTEPVIDDHATGPEPDAAVTPEPPVTAAPTVTDHVAELTDAIRRLEATVAALPDLVQRAVKAGASADLTKTLKSIQSLLRHPQSDPALVDALRALHPNGEATAPSVADLVARIEAHEQRVTGQLSAIADRMADLIALQAEAARTPMPDIPPAPRIADPEKARRLSSAIADVRRLMERPSTDRS